MKKTKTTTTNARTQHIIDYTSKHPIKTLGGLHIAIAELEKYLNPYGFKALEYGKDLINIKDGARLYMTALVQAKVSYKTRRDHCTNATIGKYLDTVLDRLGAFWKNIREGYDLNINSDLKEDAQNAIHDALCILCKHNGEVYTEDIAKEARNAVSRQLYRTEEKLANENSLDEKHKTNTKVIQIPDSRVTISPIISHIFEGIQISRLDKYIYLEIEGNGRTQSSVACDLGINQPSTAKRLNKTKKAIAKYISENGIVYDTHTNDKKANTKTTEARRDLNITDTTGTKSMNIWYSDVWDHLYKVK